jgi:hypothetical protein
VTRPLFQSQSSGMNQIYKNAGIRGKLALTCWPVLMWLLGGRHGFSSVLRISFAGTSTFETGAGEG